MASVVQVTAAYEGTGTVTASGTSGTLVESTPLTSIAPFPFSEPSGIIASRQHDGIFWTHRDGARPTLYASLWSAGRPVTNGVSGSTHKAISVTGWTAVDFEDITIDTSHNLWLADMGNNSGVRTNLKIVKVAEPNPTSVSTVAATAVYPIVWPAGAAESDGDDPDCEAIFWAKGGTFPYVLTKHRNVASGVPGCYRMNSTNTGSNNTLLFVDDVTIPSMPSMPYNQDYRPTFVDVTQDGEYMVIGFAGWRSVTYQCTNLALTGDAWVSNILANPIDYTPYKASQTTSADFISKEGGAFGNTYQHDLVTVADSSAKFYREHAAYLGIAVPSGSIWTTPPVVNDLLVGVTVGQVGSTEGQATVAPTSPVHTLVERAFRTTDVESAGFRRWATGGASDLSLGTWTNNNGSANRDIFAALLDLRGIDLTNPVATTSENTGSSTTASTGTFGSVTSGEYVAVIVVGTRNGPTTFSGQTNSYTEKLQGDTANATTSSRVSYAVYTKVFTGTSVPSMSVTLSTSRPWAVTGMVFKAASGAQQITIPSLTTTTTFNAPEIFTHEWSNLAEVEAVSGEAGTQPQPSPQQELQKVSMTIDGTVVPVTDPQWSAVVGGYDVCTATIMAEHARQLPTSVQQGSTLTIYTEDSTVRFQGRLATDPTPQDEGTYTVKAVGHKVRAEKENAPLRYQTRDYAKWADGHGEPHNLRDDPGVDVEVTSGSLLYRIADGDAIASGDQATAVLWAEGTDLHRIKYDWGSSATSGNWDLRIVRYPGPDGSGTVEDTQNISSLTGTVDQTISTPQDMLGVQLRRNTTGTAGKLRVRLKNVLVWADRTQADTFDGDEVLTDIADSAGFDPTGVAGLAEDMLPLWADEGELWADIISYVCMIHDGWWRVLDDRGDGPYLEAGLWADARTWTVTARGSTRNLQPMEKYNGASVTYKARSGKTRKKTVTVAVPSLDDRGLTNIYPLELADVQADATLATLLATNVAEYLASDRYEGTIEIVEAFDEAGRNDPFGVLPGDLIKVADWDQGQSKTLRVTQVTSTPFGVSVSVGGDFLPVERIESLHALQSARRRMAARIKRNRNYFDFTGQAARLYLRMKETDAGARRDLGRDPKAPTFRQVNRIRRRLGQSRLTWDQYKRRFR